MVEHLHLHLLPAILVHHLHRHLLAALSRKEALHPHPHLQEALEALRLHPHHQEEVLLVHRLPLAPPLPTDCRRRKRFNRARRCEDLFGLKSPIVKLPTRCGKLQMG
jgi:hypothetical protein